MRRTLPTLLALLALTACSTRTDAETAYLAAMQDRSALVSIDEQAALDQGRFVCDTLTDFQPDERRTVAGLLLTRGDATYPDISTATTHLCPEVSIHP